MEVKSYKQMCELLEEKYKGGNSKKSQLKDWKRYFKYHKDGNKFIIDKIYNKPLKNKDNGITYIENIEKLILDLLVQSDEKGKVFLSKNKLYMALEMINENYAYCKKRIPKLSKFTNINEMDIHEWYDTTKGMLQRNLEKALQSLRNQALIMWSQEVTVCKVIPMNEKNKENEFKVNKIVNFDEYDEEIVSYKIKGDTYVQYREATDKEKKFILRTERKIMKELRCENKQEIIRNKLWDSFCEQINNTILDKLNISFYYKSYKILFNSDHIFEEWESLLNLPLKEKEKIIHKYKINKGISERVTINAKNRHKKAIKNTKKTLGCLKNEKIKRRISDEYVNNHYELTSKLINQKAKDIRKEVKVQKI